LRLQNVIRLYAGSWIGTLEMTYDDLGNIRAIKDPLGHTTTYSYTDSWANASCPPPSNSLAYVTQVTNALSQNVQVTYEQCTGLVQAQKDQNDINASRAGTTYQYDTLGNLLCAVQKGTDTTAFTTCAAASSTWRPRSFTYNSLLVQFGAHRGLQGSHIGGHIVYFYNV
jgi:YD repeat-containing protein